MRTINGIWHRWCAILICVFKLRMVQINRPATTIERRKIFCRVNPLHSKTWSLTSLHECNSPSGVPFKEHGEYESHPDTSCILAYSSNSDVGAFCIRQPYRDAHVSRHHESRLCEGDVPDPPNQSVLSRRLQKSRMKHKCFSSSKTRPGEIEHRMNRNEGVSPACFP